MVLANFKLKKFKRNYFDCNPLDRNLFYIIIINGIY